MENHKMEQPSYKNVDAKRAKVEIVFFLKTLSLTVLGIIPLYPGYILCFLQCATISLEFIPSLYSNRTSLYALSVIYSFSPIWILFADPCAMAFAQYLSTANMLITAIEYRKKRARLVCLGTTMLSWCVALGTKGISYE